MARVYRLWVKYPAVHIADASDTSLPGNFRQGLHGYLWLNYDQQNWFAPPGFSADLARRHLGGASGVLKESSTDTELYTAGTLVGITSVSYFKTLTFQGTIGVRWFSPPRNSGRIFTEGLYFSREPTWADRSTEEKMSILIQIAASKYAKGAVMSLLQGLLPMIAQMAIVMVCLAGLSAILGPTLAAAIGLVLGVVYVLGRGDQYGSQFRTINEVLNSTSVTEADQDRGGQAVAAFVTMFLEDVTTLAGARGIAAVRNVLTNRGRVQTASAEVYKPPEQSGTGALSFRQVYVAAGRGFKGMPAFVGKTYGQLAEWLRHNGFEKVKDAVLEQGSNLPGTKNTNAGGSEIWFRRSKLGKYDLTEAIRIDVHGHDVSPKTLLDMQAGQPAPAGARGHFHKEVIAANMEQTYLRENVNNRIDFDDFGRDVEILNGTTKEGGYWKRTHNHIRR